MKIAVIAADGRTGKLFCERAAQNGHFVNAGIFTDTTFNSRNINAIHCDATQYKDVAHLIKGCDVVVSLIGHVRGSQPDIQTKAIQNCITAMENNHLTRIISLTGTGVRMPEDAIPIYDWPLNLAIRIIDPKRIEDGKRHAELLMAENKLAWTIVRVLKLTNGKEKPFCLSTTHPTKLFTSREEVSSALLQILEEESFIRQSPVLSSAN